MAKTGNYFLYAMAAYLLLSAWVCGTEPPSNTTKDAEALEFFVIDDDGEPLAGVEAHWWAMGPIRPESAEPIAVSDRSGRIRIDGAEPQTAIGVRWVLLLKDGKACDLIESSYLNRGVKLTMEKEVPLSVIVYDEEGKPMEGANVSPSAINFDRWSYLTPSMIARLQNQVDATGRVQVHGAKEGCIEELAVSVPGKGTRGFTIPSDRAKDEPVELIWPNFHGAIRCKVIDSKGAPVVNAPVTAMNETNPLAIKKPSINYWNSGLTNEEGIYLFEDIPVANVAIESIFRERCSNHASQKNIPVVNGKTIDIELKLEETRPVHFSVLDVSDYVGHAGIKVVFRKSVGDQNFFAWASTDAKGQGAVDLTMGRWEIDIRDLELIPVGYLPQGPITSRVIEVTSKQTEFKVPPLAIVRGDLLEGTIRGFDLASFRSNFIVAIVKSKKEEKYLGKFDLDGNFRVTVPKGTAPESLVRFQLSVAPRRALKELRIVDREEWILEAK